MASGGQGNSSSTFRSPGYPQSRQTSYMTGASSSSSVMGDGFTPQMRDRQARGKDPYHSGENSEGSDVSDREGGGGSRLRLGSNRPEQEDYSRIERRNRAAAFLDSPELMMMYAQSTGDSMAGVRLHFTRMLCGYDKVTEEENASRENRSRRSGSHHGPGTPSRREDKRRGGERAGSQ